MNSLVIFFNGLIIGAILRFLYLVLSVSGVFRWFEGKFFDICYFCLGGWASFILAGIVQTIMGYSALDVRILLSACIGSVMYYQLLLRDDN